MSSSPHYRVRRVLVAYERTGEALVSELALPSVTDEDLALIFRRTDEDPLFYASYPVTSSEAATVERLAGGHKLELDRYDYFLECHQVEE